MAFSIPRRLSIAVLLAFAVVICFQRLRLSTAPLYGDICAYAVIGHEMMHGRQLYSDLWERKPPLLYITYAAAELITGYGRNEILLLEIITSLSTLLLIYLAGKSGDRGPLGGLLAAGFWVLLNCDLDLTANQPDPETFINVFLTAAFLLLIHPPKWRWCSDLLLGALLASATLYKHNTAIVCATLLLGQVVLRQRKGLIDSLISGGVMLTVWIAMAGYFCATRRWHIFVDVLFHQNFSYSGSMAANLAKTLQFGRLFPSFMIWALAPVCLIVILWVFLFRDRRDLGADSWQSWCLLFAWVIGTCPTIGLTGLIYPHYYQLWLPIGCLAGGWAGAGLLQSPVRIPPLIRYAAVILAMLALTVRQAGEFLLTPEQWVHRQFMYFDVAAQNRLGVQLGRLLESNEPFYELGEDNALYFFSKHSPPTGLLFIDPFLYGDETKIYGSRLLRDLNRTEPVLVILSDNWTPFFKPDALIFQWLKQNYTVWETPLGWPHYHMFVRNGRKLKAASHLTAG